MSEAQYTENNTVKEVVLWRGFFFKIARGRSIRCYFMFVIYFMFTFFKIYQLSYRISKMSKSHPICERLLS